jgi:hypothetical protein
MANHALASLETALRARKLDRTLTTALPPLERHDACHDASALIATDVATLDARLRGGLPRGQLSEVVGPPSSGRTTLVLQTLAASTRRGEIAALVDTFDRLDVASAADAGIDLDRLLWIRGFACRVGPPEGGPYSQVWGPASAGPDAAVNRALKALNLVLQAGGFACVVLDLGDAPLIALKRIPFTTWLRVQRVIEGSDTACVLVAPQPLARSAGGLTLMLTGHARWTGDADRSRHLTGADLAVRVVSPRRRVEGEVSVSSSNNFQ